MQNKTLNEMAAYCHNEAVRHGFYDSSNEHNLGTDLMLIVSELSEALEADRKNRRANVSNFDYATKDTTPGDLVWTEEFRHNIKDTLEDELADALIRIFDTCGYLGVNLDLHVALKLKYNETRGYRHGKKY